MSKARKQLQERHSIERKALEERHARERAQLRADIRAAHRRQWQEEKRALEAEGFVVVLGFKGSRVGLKALGLRAGSGQAQGSGLRAQTQGSDSTGGRS